VLVLGHRPTDFVLGTLILGLVATMALGTTAMLIFLFRTANLARLQTDFVNKVSHDLRTPLTGIRMFAETLLLGRAKDPDEVRECLESIQAEATRLSTMIERLLEWGRMEAGRRPYEPAPHDVRGIVDAALAMLAPQLRACPAVIETKIPECLPKVLVDRDAVAEALFNILENAHKYAQPHGHIIVTASVEGRTVKLAVTDNGPGVPKQDERTIFEKFSRGSDERSRSVPGMGLGLAIVEHIVRAHGGRVTLASEPGKGATFTLHLPTNEEETCRKSSSS